MIPPRTLLALAVFVAFPAIARQAGEADPEPEAPTLEARAGELQRRIAELAAVDPMQPEALEARMDYARLLHNEAAADCAPQLDEAERQLAPILEAGREHHLAWPDGLGDALSLMQSIQNTRGLCAGSETAARAAFEAAIATGTRAIEVLRENWDYEEMAIAQFNLGFARRELGDRQGALRDLEQVIAWDLEFGLRDDLEDDYSTLVRWENGEDPDPEDVRQFVGSYNQARARFRFAWKPYRATWTTQVDRAVLKQGVVQSVAARHASEVVARQERDDWVISTRAVGRADIEAPDIRASGVSAEVLQELLGGAALAFPDVVLAADGSFKQVRNLEAFRTALAAAIDRALAQALPAGAPGPAPGIAEAVKTAALNPELLAATIGARWDFAIAAWTDSELDHGDWYEGTVEEPLPGISKRPVRMTWRFKVARWLPCAAGREPACVELLVRVEPDPAQMREVTAELIGRMVPAADRARWEQAAREVSLRIEQRYRLITEPDTLRPWSVEERKYVYGSFIEEGKRGVSARYDRTLETVQYLE